MSETAVLDAPKTEEKAAPFVMPLPQPDAQVRWYAKGIKNNEPRMGYVMGVFPGTRRVRIFVPSEQLGPIKTAMHIDDPDVVNRPMSVQNEVVGAWDFSTEHYRRAEWEEKMLTEFNALKAQVAELIAQWNDPSPIKKKA